MSANNAQESVITLPEWVGVITDLQQKCTGKRSRLWFNAFKRFLKKEEAWIKTEKIVWVPQNFKEVRTAHELFSYLKSIGLIFSDWDAVFASDSGVEFEYIPEGFDVVPPHHVVSVRVSDLLSEQERLTMTYGQILEKAYKEYDLDVCDLRSGLWAILMLIQRSQRDPSGTTGGKYSICTKPIQTHSLRTVPVLSVCSGMQQETGYAMFYNVDHRSKYALKNGLPRVVGDYICPDSHLIFRQIAT